MPKTVQTIEQVVAAATAGLRPDPELRLDVAQELRTHLEDCAEAYRGQGASASDAEAMAVRQFGEPHEVGRRVRNANFRRMRLRAVTKWAVRITLVPAAVALTLLFLLHAVDVVGGFVSVGLASGFFAKTPDGLRWTDQTLARAQARTLRKDLTPRQQAILLEGRRGASLTAQGACRLTRRFPDDPVLCACAALAVLGMRAGAWRRTERAVRVAGAREMMEPQNGFYNVMRAALLLDRSVSLYRRPASPHEWRLTVRDVEGLQAALGELRMAAAKGRYEAHALDFVERVDALHRHPEAYAEAACRMLRLGQARRPDLPRLRRCLRGALVYARELAASDRPATPVPCWRQLTNWPWRWGARPGRWRRPKRRMKSAWPRWRN